MNNASRVGEIFTSAGAALNLLGELTMQLESAGPSAPGSGTKWTDQEINMLQNAVANFANDLNLISETIKSRTVQQVGLIFIRQYFILFSKDFRLMSHIF